MANSNTRSGNVVTLQASPAQPGDCISEKMMSELLRRLTASVVETSTPGDAVVSRTPPDDRSKIWYPADDNGFPVGTAYKFDPIKGQWVSTAVVPQAPPCRSTDADSMITLDAAGCWKVDRDAVVQIVNDQGLQVSADSGNAIRVGSDGGLYVAVSDTAADGQIEIYNTPIEINTATAAVGSTTIDLSSLVGVTVPTWATHALVRAKCGIFTNNLGSNSTDKGYVKVNVNGKTVASVGPNPGTNNQVDSTGDDTNDTYGVLDGTDLTYEFVLHQSPGWGSQDMATFSLLLLGFVRAGIPDAS